MNVRMETALWIIVAAAAAAGTVGWRAGIPVNVPGAEAVEAVREGTTRIGFDSLKTLAEFAVARDPFRFDRRPSPVAYRADLDGGAPPPAPPLRPALVLKGVLGGPPWQALLEGLPGREGSVLATAGQSFGALRVHSVRPDTVIVKGTDTTWVLTVRRVWQ